MAVVARSEAAYEIIASFLFRARSKFICVCYSCPPVADPIGAEPIRWRQRKRNETNRITRRQSHKHRRLISIDIAPHSYQRAISSRAHCKTIILYNIFISPFPLLAISLPSRGRRPTLRADTTSGAKIALPSVRYETFGAVPMKGPNYAVRSAICQSEPIGNYVRDLICAPLHCNHPRRTYMVIIAVVTDRTVCMH